MRTATSLRCCFALACLLPCLASRGDITYGGNARAIAMGGAGLAIVDRSERNTRINPASLALLDRRFRVGLPSIGFHASGIPLDQAYKHLIEHPTENDAVSLARDFGKRQSDFGAALQWGLSAGHIELRAEGYASIHVIPNAALASWAQTADGDVRKLTGAERADMLGAGVVCLPTVGVAERVSAAGSPTRVEAGVRVKLMRGIYTHYLVDSANLLNNTAGSPAPELHGRSSVSQYGLGVDLGLLAHPRDHAGFSGALVVMDLVEPNLRFEGTDASGNPARYDIQPRSVSVGCAYEAGRTICAFDVVDLSRAYGNVQARFGAEYTTRRISLRAGYASARGFTAGFGWGILQFAFGAKAPLTVTETLRF